MGKKDVYVQTLLAVSIQTGYEVHALIVHSSNKNMHLVSVCTYVVVVCYYYSCMYYYFFAIYIDPLNLSIGYALAQPCLTFGIVYTQHFGKMMYYY